MKQSWYRPDPQLQIRMFLTMFLLAAVYLLFIAVMLMSGARATTTFLFALVMLGAQYFFSDKLVLMSAGARVVERDEAPELYEMVARLAQQADLPMPKVAIVPSRVPNAFATGRDQRHAVVAVTRGLLDLLTPSELEAVLAHELTHIRNRDVAVMTMASFFATVAQLVARWLMWAGFGGSRRRRNGGSIAFVWLVSLLVWLVSFFLLRALSRYREYAADRGAALLTGSPSALASALLKISGAMNRVPQRDLREVEGLSAFFIVPAGVQNLFIELISTHPPLEKRLAYLERLQQEMAQ